MEGNPFIDPVSDVPYFILDIGVQYFFSDWKYDRAVQKERTQSNRYLIITGSKIENLDLPFVCDIEKETHIVDADTDYMICLKLRDPISYTVETHGQHADLRPGYCYLKVSKVTKESMSFLYKWKGEFYIKNNILAEDVFSRVDTTVLDRLCREGGYSSYNRTVESNLCLSLSLDTDCSDFVPCMDVPWPADAGAWFGRKRENGWPTQDMIRHVLARGCHIVSKPHPFSPCQDIEWRYSFSIAEVFLSQTLNRPQITIYKVFKALIKHHEKTCDLSIPSYYLKITLFWVCEESPRSTWTLNHLGRSFLCLLDKFLQFLRNHNLPHYFIPENNLIEHLPQEEVKRWIVGVEYIRIHPLRCMHDFHSRYTNNPVLGPIKDINFITILMKDAYHHLLQLTFAPARDPSETLAHTRSTLMLFSIYYGVDHHHGMMLSLSKIKFCVTQFSDQMHVVKPLEMFLSTSDEVLLLLKRQYKRCIITMTERDIFLESTIAAIHLSTVGQVLSVLNAEAACICYQISSSTDEDPNTETEMYFRAAVYNEYPIWTSVIKYAQYLMVRGRYYEAFPLLQEIVQKPETFMTYMGTTYVAYSKYTSESVESTLRVMHAIDDEEMLYEAHALAYYLLLICCRELERDPEEYGIPKANNYCQVLGRSPLSIFWGDMRVFEGCFLMKYGNVQEAVPCFRQILYDRKARCFFWYGIAKIVRHAFS